MGQLEDFYGNPDLDDGFGSMAGGRTNPHRGLDCPHRAGTPIPALQAGTVVISEWHFGLGWIIEVAGVDGVFRGVAHMIAQGLAVGAQVRQGDILGRVGNSGQWSFGAHAHLTRSLSRGGIFGYADRVLDPWPDIQAILASLNPLIPLKEDEMFIAVINGAWYLIVPDGSGKPRAVVLGGESGAASSGIPVIHFTWRPAIDQLKKAVIFS